MAESSRQAKPSPSPEPDTAESTSSGSQPSAFWTHKGMDTFFNWLPDPHNHQRIYKKNPVTGQKSNGIHKEIAALVNAKHKLDWTEARLRLQEELRAERAKFRKEMADQRAGFKKNTEDEWALLRRERAEFSKERDNLKAESAALRNELEVRNTIISK
ncbi:hypothetical protein BG015_008072 [Linnemannia schmuckeri]|uniref:Uncharacterized protein n=1 Tax=Linnemannia schmuckeri TaxID=64567 RepID=A0A9P5VAY6_9FUNG|nr:hypothetical protein BG015_008072 [Linnemannia schmuckeri]